MGLAFRPVPAPHLIRLISPADDAAIAALIRGVMPEFCAAGATDAWAPDAEVTALSQAYAMPRSAYFVVEQDGALVGGAGVAPLAGAAFEVCELRKMYFLPAARGQGMGARLLRHCIRVARGFGYQACYLETLTQMHAARHLYEREGFQCLPARLGTAGGCGCDRWFALEL